MGQTEQIPLLTVGPRPLDSIMGMLIRLWAVIPGTPLQTEIVSLPVHFSNQCNDSFDHLFTTSVAIYNYLLKSDLMVSRSRVQSAFHF
jgi:hypothetical protein